MHPDTLFGIILFGPFLFVCALIAPFLRSKP